MAYLKLNNKYWDTTVDTGFGARMQNWTYAYKLNWINDFNYTILADDYKWRELKYLDFPYTESGINVNYRPSDSSVILDDKTHPHKHIHGSKATLPTRPPELYFGKLTRHIHKGDSWMDSTKAKEVTDKDWFLDIGMEYDPGVISLIKLKDTVLKDKIKELVKDRVGIHIRHWPVYRWKNNRKNLSFYGPTSRKLDYEDKMDRVREVLDNFPNSKFYISTDVTYDKPSHGPCLPDFRNESHWISEIYRDYDVIDYRNIISVDELLATGVKMVGYYHYQDILEYPEDIQNDIYNIKVKRDVVDLFSLIYSKEFISSSKTGIESHWSEFVEYYRKGIKK